jgi:hypothetical protein
MSWQNNSYTGICGHTSKQKSLYKREGNKITTGFNSHLDRLSIDLKILHKQN